MTSFLLRRAGLLLLTIVVSSFLVFAATNATPGTVARKTLGPYASERQVELLNQRLKLEDPLLLRYVRWGAVLLGLMADPLSDPNLEIGYSDPRGPRYLGNFGYSAMARQPVADVIWGRLGNSLLLGGLALLATVPLALLIGIVSGLAHGTMLDRGVSVFATIITAIPEYASAVAAISVFVISLGLLPGTSPLVPSRSWSVASQFVLPVIVLTLSVAGYLGRIVRASIVTVAAQPYVRTAFLKGLPWHTVVLRHVLRNAMIAPVTVLFLQVNWLLSGVVVTEVLFAYPGIGRMLLEAALFGDLPVIVAAAVISVVLASVTQLLSDVAYRLLNPRIRLV